MRLCISFFCTAHTIHQSSGLRIPLPKKHAVYLHSPSPRLLSPLRTSLRNDVIKSLCSRDLAVIFCMHVNRECKYGAFLKSTLHAHLRIHACHSVGYGFGASTGWSWSVSSSAPSGRTQAVRSGRLAISNSSKKLRQLPLSFR
jgi:hypothetical protein